MLDAVQHLIDARPLGKSAQFTAEVLLQGLASPLSPALQGRVNVVGKVSYQQVRHAYIMLSSSPVGKATPRRAGFEFATHIMERLAGAVTVCD